MPKLFGTKDVLLAADTATGAGADVSYSTAEKTRSQVFIGGDDPQLQRDSKTSSATVFKAVREMRKHPTVSLARQLCIAPLLSASWSIESKDDAPEGAKELIQDSIEPLRIHLLRTSLFNCIDYGFAAYEKVFKIDEKSGLVVPLKLKPLLNDKTDILIDPANGSFAGLFQSNPDVTLGIPESLLVNIDVEGTYWYGQPVMTAVQTAYDQWQVCNNAAVRYDKKIAGAHWVITYPPGTTPVNGVEKDNFEIAKEILGRLESSGGVVVPRTLENYVDDLNKNQKAWEIEILSAYPTSNVTFIDRLKYLDALMVRAFGLPERAVLEGQFGTKAESEAHADFAISNMELRHKIIVQTYNWHLVNQLLRINYGPEFENSVFISVAPITDLAMQYLREIYKAVLSNANGFATESLHIDMQGLRDKLGIPSATDQDIVDQQDPVLNPNPPIDPLATPLNPLKTGDAKAAALAFARNLRFAGR
jgi:hypothetical protein